MRLPPRCFPSLVQARSIDDVPVMALTLWGEPYDDVQLRAMAAQLQETLKSCRTFRRSPSSAVGRGVSPSIWTPPH